MYIINVDFKRAEFGLVVDAPLGLIINKLVLQYSNIQKKISHI